LPDDHDDDNDEAPEVPGVEDAVTTPTPTSADTEESASPPTMPTTLLQQHQQAPMVWPAEPSPIDDAVESLARRAGTTATDTIVMQDDADNDDPESLSSVPTVWPESNPSVVADANAKDNDDGNDDTEARRSSLPPVPSFWPADAPVVHDKDENVDDKEATRPPVPTVWPEEAPVVHDDKNDDDQEETVPTVWSEEAPVAVVDDDEASGPPVPTVWPEEAPAVVDNDKTSLPPPVPKEAAAAVARPPTDDDDATIDLDEDDATTEEVVVPVQEDDVVPPAAKAPPGSLAGFFETLEDKKNTSNEGLPDVAATLAAAQVDTTASDRVDETLPPPEEEDTYWGIWGGRTYHKRADLSVLTLLFQDLLLQAQADGVELGTTMEDLLDASLTSTGLHADDITIPEAPQSHFLDGLDDLDKLFEDVDPPDELDISLGSSMQEILVGRGSQIVRKHVVKGLQALQQGLRQIRTTVTNKVTDEEGRLRLVSKEELVHAGQWLIQTAQRTYDTLQVFVDDLFEGNGEDETVADDDMLKEIQKRTGAS
jgi:hypothetical protein